METELEDLNPKSNSNPSPPEPTIIDDASTKDDRPLLKPDQSPATAATAAQPNIAELEKKYSAYVRHDAYGTMGMAELPWTEKVLIGFALVTLLPLRVVISLTILVVYYLICRVCTLFSAPNREEEQEDYAHMGGWRRTVVIQSGRFLARVMLFVIGFYWIHETYRILDLDDKLNSEVECKDRSDKPERPGAIVSNHVSYLDILYHMSASFPSFVAKRSVGKLPLVGLISKCLGCVYVQRESKSSDFKGVSGVVNERVWGAYQNKSAPMMMLFPG